MHRIAHTVQNELPAGSRRMRRLGLAGLLLIMLGGLLLTPALRPRQTEAATWLTENFDSVTPGRIPAGWAGFYQGDSAAFAVTRQESSSAPQSLRTNGTDQRGFADIDTPVFNLPADAGGIVEVSFRHKYNLEKSWTGYCNDGAMLRVKKNGSTNTAFEDVTGASIMTGGYTAKVNSSNNIIADKFAWCGDSGGWVTTRVRFYDITKSIQLEWRAGFDGSTSAGPWMIDDLQITYLKKPVISFTATTSDGRPYLAGDLSMLPVNVTARCAGDGRAVSHFRVTTSGGFEANGASGAPVTVPTFTKDGLDQHVTATCAYQGTGVGQTTEHFAVRIAQTDLTVTLFGPSVAGPNSQVRYTAAVSNIGTRTTPSAFDFVIKTPAAFGLVAVMAPPQATCVTGAPAGSYRPITCRIASLAPNGSVYIPFDMQVTGPATGGGFDLSVSPSFPDRTQNNRFVWYTAIGNDLPDLSTELNAFSGIQMNMDNEIEVRVHNRGIVDASKVTARVVLPAELTYVGTLEPDACTAAGQVLTCTFMPTIRAGQSDHIEILVRPTSSRTLTVQAQADAANAIAESNETNNGATMSVVVGGGPARS
jgi:hypothetical protein